VALLQQASPFERCGWTRPEHSRQF